MNTLAVLLGLFYGVISIIACYVVSMITSGLFARPIYRLYARLLIGICAVMLAAPGLRWLAASNPRWAVMALTVSQYAVMGVLGYGVFRFNRDFMKKVFVGRSSTAYFVFGTLANASIVTMGFLHAAVSGAPGWGESATGYLAAANYGPLMVLLSAMIFHTDYCLKNAVGDLRRFSRFTFLGYAVSFLGLGLSVIPYVATGLGQLNLVAVDSPLLQNFFGVQAFLFAIVVYGWMVWRYESIPPLFLLLFAIVAEYHILVTQWVTEAFGPASWGLASMPLFAGLLTLDHYFAKWDERKEVASKSKGKDRAEPGELRFAIPFRLVGMGMAIALLGVTLWTRFSAASSGSPVWLAATFAVYSVFFAIVSFIYQRSNLLYAAGLLTALAALLGFEVVGGDMAVAAAGVLALLWSSAAWLGTRIGLKTEWRTPLSDNGLITAVVVIAIVSARHLFFDHPYFFQAVSLADGISLLGASAALFFSASAYRSRLPVFAGLYGLALVIPPWNAALGLAATGIASLIERKSKSENRHALDDRLRLFGKLELPQADVLPSLYVQSLKLGAIPLALIGLMMSAIHVFQGNLTPTVLVGAAISALALLMLSLSYRDQRLYVTALLATYFATHVAVQGTLLTGLPAGLTLTAHLAVASILSIVGWIVAWVYASWCTALLKRVAESKETEIRERRSFYSGLLFYVTTTMALITQVITLAAFVSESGLAGNLVVAAVLTSVLMAFAASLYRSQVWTYLALSSGGVASMAAIKAFNLLYWEGNPAVVAVIAAAIASTAFRWTAATNDVADKKASNWISETPWLRANGLGLWVHPVTVSAIVCGLFAAVTTFPIDSFQSNQFQPTATAALVYALVAVAFIISTRVIRSVELYVMGIAFAFASAHGAVTLLPNARSLDSNTMLIHLTLSAALCLMASVTATALAVGMNRIARRCDEDRVGLIDKQRWFYTGILMHFSFAVSLLTLFGLSGATLLFGFASANELIMGIGLSVLLAVTFALMSVIYRSRIPTYCSLAGACFAFYWSAAVFSPDLLRGDFQTVALMLTAVGFGAAAWFMTRLESTDQAQPTIHPRTFDCWAKPPLSLVSNDASLWSIPLAHVSVLLTVAGLVTFVHGWLNSDGGDPVIWLKVIPLYLASIPFLIATKTHQVSAISIGTGSANKPRHNVLITGYRVFFYISALVTFGVANHVTVQLSFLDGLPLLQSASWHLLVASISILVGWTVATAYTYLRNQKADRDAEPPVVQPTQSVVLFGGVLHHFVFAVSISTLTGCFLFGVPPNFTAAPVIGCLGLLIVYFFLASFTYRFQLPSYLATITMGLATVHAVALTGSVSLELAVHLSSLIAMLGLSMACLALLLGRRSEDETVGFGLSIPSPWSTTPLTLKSLWLEPLCNSSLLYAGGGFILLMACWIFDLGTGTEAPQVMISCLLVAATFFILAHLYQSPAFTYVGAFVVAVAMQPAAVVLGQPASHLGIGLAVVAFSFWICGFAAERIGIRRLQPDEDAKQSATIRIYERPLVRSSALLAGIAMLHSLVVWWFDGWAVSQTPIVVASALGAVTLLMNARSLSVLERVAWARVMVYFACVSLTCCWLAAYSMTWNSLRGLGPNAALTALVLGAIGLVIVENARSIAGSRPASADSRLTFGEPISHFGSALAILSVALAGAALIHTGGVFVEVDAGRVSLASSPGLLPLGVTLIVSALACLVSVRVQAHIAWLYAAVVFGSAGMLCVLESMTAWSAGTSAVVAMIVMNSCVVAGHVVRANRDRVSKTLGLNGSDCQLPFADWPVLFTSALLLGQCIYLGGMILGAIAPVDWPWITVNLLSGLLFLQGIYLRREPRLLHLLVGSSAVAMVGYGIGTTWSVTPDVAFSSLGLIWGVIAGIASLRVGGRLLELTGMTLTTEQRKWGEKILIGWSITFTMVGLAMAIPVALLLHPRLPNVTIVLSIAALVTCLAGVRWQQVASATTSAVLFPLSLVSAIVFFGQTQLLLEYGGLLAAGLALIYLGIIWWAERKDAAPTPVESSQKSFHDRSIMSLTLISGVLSGIVVLLAMYSMAMAEIALSGNALAAVFSLCLVSVYWILMTLKSDNQFFAYAAILGSFGTAAFACEVIFDLPITGNALAAFFVIGYSFFLYMVNIVVGRSERETMNAFLKPSYYVALFLPVALIVATPFDRSGIAAFVLMAAGSFYLIVHHQSPARWTLYLAAVLFNAAIYLWVPSAQQITGLYQLYVIPAAITVLVFAQLHHADLKPQVLNSIRFAACGAILAVSTFEVFFAGESSLLQFVSVLGLSLVGIAMGIALRIKPFVFMGISFLVLNVIGQLGLQFHHEGGIVRAIILIGVGLLVLGIMIVFNVHRERILRTYRGFLADNHWQ